jgi:hypothetical protein
MENIQEKFFSKNNISSLNNKLLENLDIKNLNDKQRIFIAEKIVNNMKITWKSIDISKIRPDNFQSVLNQFNNIVYKNSFDEINKLITPPKENDLIDPNVKKFQRDFHSHPNNGVIVNDRPKSVMEDANPYKKNTNSYIGPNEHYAKKSKERHDLALQPDKHLDDLFRPIVDDMLEEPNFNNYTHGRGGGISEKLQDIQKMRDTEVPLPKKGELDVPDFLKPRATSVRSQEDFPEKKNIPSENNNKKNNQKQYNENINFIDGTDDNETLFSLDNIDKPLINDDEYEEDTAPFADRLNRLKNSRENIQIPKKKTVDFTTDDFEDDFDNMQPTRIDKLKNKNYHEDDENNQYQESQNYEEKRRQYEEKRQHYQEEKRQHYQEEKRRHQYEEKRRHQYEEKKRQEQEEQEEKQYQEKRRNKHSTKITSEQREIFDKLKTLNKNLLNQLSLCKEENNQLRNDNLELAEKVQEIIEKEKELDNKYGSIINTKTFQVEITSENSISNYRYNFVNTMNIIGLKLTACSIPFKKYNIETNINNIFMYAINNIEKNIILSEGFYTIQEIIENLNDNQNDLIFELNTINQKIKVSSEYNFNIIPTTLSIINLGFKSNYNNNNIFNADTVYDLRINNKVYLFFKNITNDPITIITPNTNIYDSEILFENPVKLNYLDIVFKDENDNDYNFYNINHYIHLNLLTNNNYLK